MTGRTAYCPNPKCRGNVGARPDLRVAFVAAGDLPNGQSVYLVTCRYCGTVLGTVSDAEQQAAK